MELCIFVQIELLWGKPLGESNVGNWFPKTFSCTPDWFHVSSRNLLTRLSNERELGIISGWLETWDNLPENFDSISWNSPELFIEFICSSNCCNWKVSCWIVSWFSLNFCIENSSTYCTFIFTISCLLRICVSRRAFSFRNNSSCNRVFSRRDSTNSFCTSCGALFCASVRFCSSLMHLLRDSTWSSCCARSDLAWLNKWSLLPSRRDPLKFDGLAFLNTELLIRFPCSDENNASDFPEAFWAYNGDVSICCNSIFEIRICNASYGIV